MKPFVAFSAALLLGASALCTSALSTPAMAQSKPSTEAYYEEKPRLEAVVYPAAAPLKLWMNVEKEDPRARIKVELFDAQNHLLHSQTYNARVNRFNQKFDLSNMPDGRYTFRITDGNSVRERTFKLSSPGLQEQLPNRLVTLN